MGKKLNIDKKTINLILKDKNILSLRKLGEKYSLNKNVIIRILKSQNTNLIKNIEYLKCKKTNQILYDVHNKSGTLTKHLKKYYNDFELKDINDYLIYFNIKYNNKNLIIFKKFIKELRLKHSVKIIFNGLTKFSFKNRNIFFIENEKIINNDKIVPILFFRLKNRYNDSIFIYEDEWVNKQKIVEGKIKMVLNVSKNPKIYARNCKIEEISPSVKNGFLNNNHVQGTTNSSIALGAFYKNELVAVMTFTTNRNMTKDEIKFDYELNRFATDINYHVIGIGGKLFNFFLNKVEKNALIVSYGDRRFVLNAQNNIYKKLNFNLNQISKHNYTYIESNSINRIHKITMQGKLKRNDSNLKETEYCNMLGYKKIWDCGKYRFTYKNI